MSKPFVPASSFTAGSGEEVFDDGDVAADATRDVRGIDADFLEAFGIAIQAACRHCSLMSRTRALSKLGQRHRFLGDATQVIPHRLVDAGTTLNRTSRESCGGTVTEVCSRPQACSVRMGSQRSSSVAICRIGGISLFGLMKEPCRCCGPRLMTLLSVEEPQIRQVLVYVRCMEDVPIVGRNTDGRRLPGSLRRGILDAPDGVMEPPPPPAVPAL